MRTEFIGGVLCSTLADVRRLGEQKADREWQEPATIGRQEAADIRKRGLAARERLRKCGFLK